MKIDQYISKLKTMKRTQYTLGKGYTALLSSSSLKVRQLEDFIMGPGNLRSET